jgi:hypothetical protein
LNITINFLKAKSKVAVPKTEVLEQPPLSQGEKKDPKDAKQGENGKNINPDRESPGGPEGRPVSAGELFPAGGPAAMPRKRGGIPAYRAATGKKTLRSGKAAGGAADRGKKTAAGGAIFGIPVNLGAAVLAKKTGGFHRAAFPLRAAGFFFG